MQHFQYQGRADVYPAIKRDSTVGAWQQGPQVPPRTFPVAILVVSTAFIGPPIKQDSDASIWGKPTNAPYFSVPRQYLIASGGVLTFRTLPIPEPIGQNPDLIRRIDRTAAMSSADLVEAIPPPVKEDSSPGSWGKQADIPYFPVPTQYLIASGGIIVPRAAPTVQPIIQMPDVTRRIDRTAAMSSADLVEAIPPPVTEDSSPGSWGKQADVPYFPVPRQYLVASGGVWIDPTPSPEAPGGPVGQQEIPRFEIPRQYLIASGYYGVVPISFVVGITDEWVIQDDPDWEIKDDKDWRIQDDPDWEVT